MFLNLQTHKFYCLPDNYEIIDSSLDDIIVSRINYFLMLIVFCDIVTLSFDHIVRLIQDIIRIGNKLDTGELLQPL